MKVTNAPADTDDWRAVHSRGHRKFIGGAGDYWDTIGTLQFEFLKSQGLMHFHQFVDVGCGSLRGGVRLIDYLAPDMYLAIDKHIEAIIYGVAAELGLQLFREKRPRFVVTDTFEFSKLGAAPEFGIAQSLFTHLTISDIELCLRRLKEVAAPRSRFFATFFETESPGDNPSRSHSHAHSADEACCDPHRALGIELVVKGTDIDNMICNAG